VLHVFIVAAFGVLAASWDLVAGYAGQLTLQHASFGLCHVGSGCTASGHLALWGLLPAA
jgi:ABC-type branched-subunit amino acid transport system permease subunit